MWKLYRQELKRILRTRSTLLFLAAALALSVFMAWVPVTFERYAYEENGKEIVIKGPEALALTKQMEAPSAGEVTPEKLAQGLSFYHKNLEIYDDFYNEEFPLNLRVQEIYPWRPLMMRLMMVAWRRNIRTSPPTTHWHSMTAARATLPT